MTAWGARSTTVVHTIVSANRAGTMARWRTCAFGSSTPVSAGATAATLATMDDFVMAGECETGESRSSRFPTATRTSC